MSDRSPAISSEEAVSLYMNDHEALIKAADGTRKSVFGTDVYVRGLIEFTNTCSMDCLYCGIRRSNGKVARYSLDEETILGLIGQGISKGIKTFVLQGGEDPSWTVRRLCLLIEAVRRRYGSDIAVTLSTGLKPAGEYRSLKASGADRYLMRFETSDPVLHKRLRGGVSLERRLKGLHDLREAGFEVGSGYMTGLPGETEETRINNALLCRDLGLDMVGIGPFIPHPDTPLADAVLESIDYAVNGTALLRLLLPKANIPATTAAGSLDPGGREKMLGAGANVLMPNITPVRHKKDYLLYPGKICLDESGFECVGCLSLRARTVGRRLNFDRGDSPGFSGNCA